MLHAVQQRRSALAPDALPAITLVAVVAALAACVGLVLNPLLALAAAGGGVLVFVILARPAATIYIAVAVIAMADWHLTPNTTDGMRLVYSLSDIGIPLTPLEIVLVVGTLSLTLRLILDDGVAFRPGDLWVPIIVLLAAVSLGVVNGIARGGVDWSALRSETRGFLYLPVLYLVGVHFLRTPAQLNRLMWFLVVMVNVMAIESTYRYFAHVRVYTLTVAHDLAFGHDNAVLCAAAIVYLLCRVLWSPRPLAEWKSIALMALPMVALLVMRRRAGMVVLETGMVLLCLYLLKGRVRLFLTGVPLALLGAGLLLAVTWNNPGGTGQFARSFRDVTGQQHTQRDQQSNTYRDMENVNIRINIESAPVAGLGYGQPYAMYVSIPDLSRTWPLWQFVPHNTLLGMWMKGGLPAMIGILALVAAATMRSTQLAMALGEDPLRATAFAAGAFVVMFVMYSYVDLGLVEPRMLAFLGVVLGVIGALGHLVKDRDISHSAA